ncbi:MAG: hypothetical protein ACT4OS_08955 [Acidimicrobiales bacterium]
MLFLRRKACHRLLPVVANYAENFRVACEMHEAGMALMRLNLARRHEGCSPAELDELFWAWLTDRPPDAPGRPRPLRQI